MAAESAGRLPTWRPNGVKLSPRHCGRPKVAPAVRRVRLPTQAARLRDYSSAARGSGEQRIAAGRDLWFEEPGFPKSRRVCEGRIHRPISVLRATEDRTAGSRLAV